jgi:hypothetical protein
MKSRIRVVAGAFFALACFARTATACDVCAVYTATEQRESRTGPFLGVAEQFTHFGTLRRGGDEVDNPLDEKIDSSITQVIFGYAPIPALALQVNLPVIHRSFRRAEDGVARSDDETGIGDLSFLAQYALWTHVTEQSLIRFTILGGVKFPTGDSDRLAEELGEGHHEEEAAEATEAEHQAELAVRALSVAQSVRFHGGEVHGDEIESGVHGHDLALGSGSYDGIFGARLFASHDRAFATASVQYALRTTGDFDYAYADDLTWAGGPGYFLWLEHDRSLGLQASLSGETKGKDELDGARLDDTALTALYVGPGLLFTWGSSLGADLVGELPVIQNNTALQIVADYRIRGGLSWRF